MYIFFDYVNDSGLELDHDLPSILITLAVLLKVSPMALVFEKGFYLILEKNTSF